MSATRTVMAKYRRRILAVLTLALLSLAVLWSWDRYVDSRRQLQTAVAETAECRQLAATIEHLRQPSDSDDQPEMPEDQLYQRLHEASQAAGLPEGVIRNILPQSAEPTRDPAFQQKSVELTLEGLTLEQLTKFIYHLHSTNPQLQITALTLHDPKGWGPATLWNVDPLLVSYRVHVVQSGQDRAVDRAVGSPKTDGEL